MKNMEGEWSKELFYKSTCYEKSTAVSRANTDLDRHCKDSKKVNLVLENQPESSERQPADEKELRASLTAVKTGSYHPTLTALAENDDTTNDDLDYRYMKSAAGTEEKEINEVWEESEKRRIDESKQTRTNLDKEPGWR